MLSGFSRQRLAVLLRVSALERTNPGGAFTPGGHFYPLADMAMRGDRLQTPQNQQPREDHRPSQWMKRRAEPAQEREIRCHLTCGNGQNPCECVWGGAWWLLGVIRKTLLAVSSPAEQTARRPSETQATLTQYAGLEGTVRAYIQSAHFTD